MAGFKRTHPAAIACGFVASRRVQKVEWLGWIRGTDPSRAKASNLVASCY